MDVRLRLPELLDEKGVTPYRVAQDSGGRISTSVLYRIIKRGGRVELLSASLLEALCDVLNVEPGELLEREGQSAGAPVRRAATPRRPTPRKRAR